MHRDPGPQRFDEAAFILLSDGVVVFDAASAIRLAKKLTDQARFYKEIIYDRCGLDGAGYVGRLFRWEKVSALRRPVANQLSQMTMVLGRGREELQRRQFEVWFIAVGARGGPCWH